MRTMNSKLRGLFLNTSKAKCSIYESGKMCYEALTHSEDYSLNYIEISETTTNISADYDFYIFNYHKFTMGWLNTKLLKKLKGFKATLVLEVEPNNPFIYCSKNDFDAYLVLDPSLQTIETNVYIFPRPLELKKYKSTYADKKIPEIGTFGFATHGKGFDKVIKAVNEEFEEAIIKINIPIGDYVPNDYF
jgi:hypothetical protein